MHPYNLNDLVYKKATIPQSGEDPATTLIAAGKAFLLDGKEISPKAEEDRAAFLAVLAKPANMGILCVEGMGKPILNFVKTFPQKDQERFLLIRDLPLDLARFGSKDGLGGEVIDMISNLPQSAQANILLKRDTVEDLAKEGHGKRLLEVIEALPLKTQKQILKNPHAAEALRDQGVGERVSEMTSWKNTGTLPTRMERARNAAQNLLRPVNH